MEKKKIIIIIAVIIFVLMLIPIPTRWKNGVTEYKAILYKYTKVHTPSEISFTGYEDGWELKILGIRVGGNIKADEIIKHTGNSEQKNVGSILLEVKEDTRTSKGATFIIKILQKKNMLMDQHILLKSLKIKHGRKLIH